MSFCVLDDFFLFSKNLGFRLFLVHPTVVSVLLSASVERCFVSRMRDFFKVTFIKYSIGQHFYCNIPVSQKAFHKEIMQPNILKFESIGLYIKQVPDLKGPLNCVQGLITKYHSFLKSVTQ